MCQIIFSQFANKILLSFPVYSTDSLFHFCSICDKIRSSQLRIGMCSPRLSAEGHNSKNSVFAFLEKDLRR
ncbi:hypothetical protein SSYM_0839 [Serratia symbiotica str. Tucson]|uniref:Uncharacterized protein n=1 Tax=Serratia symbiotica str. Tucson TaxID=914128 RepID=E9CKY1_9GAMM|nr:hypothetical protein SSYM_0839 [Serratia symbiotica str. Tucson]